jgi:hypothetical protein
MAKQQYIQPSVAVTGDTTGYMNVISTTDGGEMQVVTTGGTINTIAPDRHIVIGNVLVTPGHYKVIPSDYHIDGDLTIEATTGITIGTETIQYEGHVAIAGNVFNCTGTVDIQGGLSLGATTFTVTMPTSGTSGTGGAYDTDAQAFLTAAAITDPTIGGAINTLVLAMKAANIWDKAVAVYPFVGGSADTHKFNLKDPQDTDGAYRMTFSGVGWTHNEFGVQLLGSGISSSYADTHLAYQTAGLTTAHMVVSINDDGSYDAGYDTGSSGGDAGDWALISDYNNNTAYFCAGAGSYLTSAANGVVAVWSGRADGTNRYLDKNATTLNSDTGSVDGSTYSLYLAAVNVGSAVQQVKNRYDFASYGTYLTEEEMTDYYNAITAFNTTLSR